MPLSDVDLAREQVTEQVLDADTLSEIETAKIVLREWMQAHPNEQAEHAHSGQHLA